MICLKNLYPFLMRAFRNNAGAALIERSQNIDVRAHCASAPVTFAESERTRWLPFLCESWIFLVPMIQFAHWYIYRDGG